MVSAIATATRRARKINGDCWLTHGSDTYDKRGRRKTQRALSKALIQEHEDLLQQEAEDEEQELWEECLKVEQEWEDTLNANADEIFRQNSEAADKAHTELRTLEKAIATLKEQPASHVIGTVHVLEDMAQRCRDDIAMFEKEMRKAYY